MADTPVFFDSGTDTLVDSAEPSLSHAGLPYATLAQSSKVYLLKQGIGSVAAGTSASAFIRRIRLVDNFGGGSVTFRLYRLAAPFSPDVLWADQPAITADTPVTITGTVTAGGVLAFDETAFVAADLAAGVSYGRALKLDTASVSGRIYTLSASDGVLGDDVTARPTLTGLLTSNPATLTNLVPNAGRAAGVAKPWVKADFGTTAILRVQVQQKAANTGFDPVTGFSSPAFDSGGVLANDARLDLSTTAFAGFTGTASYWTMRVQDTDGDWSLWADPVSARYTAKMSVFSSVPPVVSDPVPTINWATQSGTQVAYQVVISEDADHTVELYNSGIIASAAHSHTPTNFLIPDSRLMYVRIRVFDAISDRVATPGVTLYSSASSTFAYADDLTVRPPDYVAVAQIADSPFNNVYSTFPNELPPDASLILKRDGIHVAVFDVADLPAPLDTEGGFIYTITDFAAQPFVDHLYGVKVRAGGRTSNATAFAFTGRPISGMWVVDKVRSAYSQCAGMDVSFTSDDQVGILQGFGDPYVSVQVNAIGQRTGTLGGIVTDFGGVLAQDWVKAWRDIKNHPAEVQIAYGDTSFPARIWNLNISPLDDRVSPFDKVVSFSFAQTGLEHLADEPVDDGSFVELYDDFETGTSGNSLSGDTQVLSKTGSAQYLTGAAIHGTMGGDSSASGGTWTYLLPNSYASAVSVGVKTTIPASGNNSYIRVQTQTTVDIFTVRIYQTGKVRLLDGDQNALGAAGTTYVSNTPLDHQLLISWDGTTAFAVLRLFFGSNFDTAVYQDELVGSWPTAQAPYKIQFGSDSTSVRVQTDDVRRRNNNGSWFAPIAPNSALPSFAFSIPGAPDPAGAIVSTILNPVPAGTPGAVGDSINLAVSTSPTMSSPTLVGLQAVATGPVVKHTITGKAASTDYYVQPTTSTGTPFGEVSHFKTMPSTGAYSLKMVVGSCQGGDSESPGITMVYQDALAFAPQIILDLGDQPGYWGGQIGPSDPFTRDIDKYRNGYGNKPSYRALFQSAYVMKTISDHNLYDNSDYNHPGNPNGGVFGDPGAGINNSPMAIRELLAFQAMVPVRTWLDSRSPRRHRGYVVDVGSKLRFIMTDLRSPDRSNTNDPDGAGKQLWGAQQEADIFAALSPTKLNVLVNETNWYAVATGAQVDKPWNYATAQARLAAKITGTGPYAGGPVYPVLWLGGDRHYCGWLNGASNPLGGFPVAIGSGWYQNSLDLVHAEAMTWQIGAGRQPNPDLPKVPVCGYGQLTITYDGGTGMSVSYSARAVSDTNILLAEDAWTLSTYGPGTASWTI